MNLFLDGLFLIKNSHNQIINNQVGKVFYSQQMEKFIFRIFEHEDPECLGDYVVNPQHLNKITIAEFKLMRENKIYIQRPEGI